jgi:hypothetical protein
VGILERGLRFTVSIWKNDRENILRLLTNNFLFDEKVSWETNILKCCSLGMRPIMIESKTKYDCFNALVREYAVSSGLFNVYVKM